MSSWTGLTAGRAFVTATACPQRNVRGLDHDLAYRALAGGEIQATDLYSTDAEIRQYNLRLLRDDLGFFPSYECVWLYRGRSAVAIARGLRRLARLEGRISRTEMAAMNARAKIDRVPEDRSRPISWRTSSGSWFGSLPRRSSGDCSGGWASISRSWRSRWRRRLLVAIPLGIVAARRPRLGAVHPDDAGRDPDDPIAGTPGVHDPLAGNRRQAGTGRALSLQPAADRSQHGHRLARHPGLASRIGRGSGLARRARLIRIELPMASRSILAGIKTAAVINVGTATIGALIGAGGFGQPILTGIRRDDLSMILFEGAIPAALLALAVQGAFDLAERFIVPAARLVTLI